MGHKVLFESICTGCAVIFDSLKGPTHRSHLFVNQSLRYTSRAVLVCVFLHAAYHCSSHH